MDPTSHHPSDPPTVDPLASQANSLKPFSLPPRISIYASPKALYIKPDKLRAPAKSLVRIEWSHQPTLLIIQDQQTIEDELRTTSDLVLEFDGIVGLIQLFHDSYLILISSHSTVGHFDRKKINRIERVLAIPLIYSRAFDLLTKEFNRNSTKRRKSNSSTSVTTSLDSNSINSLATRESDDSDVTQPEADEDLNPDVLQPSSSSSSSLSSSIEDGFQKIVDPNKINLSRLLWKPKLVKTPSGDPQALNQERALHTNLEDPNQDDSAARLALDKRFMGVLCHELTRGGMFYALDWDITNSFQTKSDLCVQQEPHDEMKTREPKILEPLHKRAQRRFWWNQMIIQPFIKSGFDNLAYVIMQGFVESTTVELSRKSLQDQELDFCKHTSSEAGEERDETPSQKEEEAEERLTETIEIGLISRRSILRPGLRYQRRGVDSQGSVANSVESECVMMACDRSKAVGGQALLWSFVQIRGSIPLFWGQNPSALRPPIVLEGDDVENLDAMKKHLLNLMNSYGDIVAICLAEKTGNEPKIVHEFETQFQAVKEELIKPEKVNDSTLQTSNSQTRNLQFISWDFHHQCKGMHYENVMKLIIDIQDLINQLGYFSTEGDRQKGVIRSNCIDCLDRTNVIQSAIAKQILNRFLIHLNLPIHGEDPNDRLDIAFNSLWANNGDQISKQYAGTSALKGDFVRTGRRNWRGVVNDATNSVARMWHNSISDFFKQSVLDYVLGINVSNFSQFQQSYSSFNDPSDLSRISKIRSAAINDAAEQVLSEGEAKVNGWIFLTPSAPNSIKSIPNAMEERIVILSSKALFIVHYEYVLSKVQEFLRIGFEDIISIQIGVYVTSLAGDRERDLTENFGLVISYDTAGATEKKNTYSMRLEGSVTSKMMHEIGSEDERSSNSNRKTSAAIKQIVLKAPKDLSVNGSNAPGGMNEDYEQVESTRQVFRISAEDFVRKVMEEIEAQSNLHKIIFKDENQTDDKTEARDDQDQSRLRRVILINRRPIVSLDEFVSLITAGNHPTQLNGLLAKMARGVKQMIGQEKNQNLNVEKP